MSVDRPPEDRLPQSKRYKVRIGNSVNSRGDEQEKFFTVKYDKKPPGIEESTTGKVIFSASRGSLEYQSAEGNSVKLSGNVQPPNREYILVFEGDQFRLEKASSHMFNVKQDNASGHHGIAVGNASQIYFFLPCFDGEHLLFSCRRVETCERSIKT